MRHLFYELVTLITNTITGLGNEHLNLWNYGTWVKTSKTVSIILGVWCALAAMLIVSTIVEMIIKIYKNDKSQKIEL